MHGNRIYHYEIKNDLLQVVFYRNNSIGEKTFKTKRRNTYINDPNYLLKDVHPSNSLLRIIKNYLTTNFTWSLAK